jgi:hypothetical protein
MNKKEISEIEKTVHQVMDTFVTKNTDITDIDRKNYALLKEIHKDSMISAVAGEFRDQEVSSFMQNFLEEFDNTYEEGLPEAIIVALKKGRKTKLTEDWWKRQRKS